MFKSFGLDSTKETLFMRIKPPTKRGQPKDRNLTTYSDVVQLLLETYASKNIIAIAESSIFPSPRMSAVAYAGRMSKHVFRCGIAYSEASKLVIYMEQLQKSIRRTVRTYWT